jgi:hypothetical protein
VTAPGELLGTIGESSIGLVGFSGIVAVFLGEDAAPSIASSSASS